MTEIEKGSSTNIYSDLGMDDADEMHIFFCNHAKKHPCFATMQKFK